MFRDILARFFRRKKKSQEVKQVNNDAVIQLTDLPDWAKKYVKKAGKEGSLTVQHGGDALTVINGKVFFNGKQAVRRGEVVEAVQTEISIEALPKEVQANIRHNLGSFVMTTSAGHSLQIIGEVVYYNGIRVLMK